MSGILIALIVSVAVVGGYYIDYLNNKVKLKADDSDIKKEIRELRTLVHQMKKRIENLETIAANDPDSFNSEANNSSNRIEIDERDQIIKENQQQVSNLAKNRGE